MDMIGGSALSSRLIKNISVPFMCNTGYKPLQLIPPRGADRDRHERGMRGGGRGGVRRAVVAGRGGAMPFSERYLA
jgi:hypothetical protein